MPLKRHETLSKVWLIYHAAHGPSVYLPVLATVTDCSVNGAHYWVTFTRGDITYTGWCVGPADLFETLGEAQGEALRRVSTHLRSAQRLYEDNVEAILRAGT